MSAPVFFRAACAPSLAEVVAWTGAAAPNLDRFAETRIRELAALEQAGSHALSFLDNPRYAPALAKTRAAAVLVPAKYEASVPAGTLALVSDEPYRAFATVAGKLFPDALRPGSLFGTAGVSPGSFVHPEARLEPEVTIDPGAIIGPRAEIGAGTVVGAHAVVGPDVRIGRGCCVGPHASVLYALIGDRVILHPGVRIGQDGFGFAMGRRGHLKVPQLGRVVIQDDVEIGANTTIDRGSNRDTTIGEGTKIDNLVQIGHNVSIGRHCVVVSQTGISGSTTLGDFAVTAGQAGLAGHLTIGAGAQIGAKSGVMNDIPPGERWFGIPAQPAREQFRLHAILRRMTRRDGKTSAPAETEGGE